MIVLMVRSWMGVGDGGVTIRGEYGGELIFVMIRWERGGVEI